MFRKSLFALSIVLASVGALAAPQDGPQFPLLDGKTAPLTLKLKDLDSNWRVFSASGGNSYLDLIAGAMGAGGGKVFTKGETVTVGVAVVAVAVQGLVFSSTAS